MEADQKPLLPYHQIPEYPENYSGENIAARVIDGLGYRYYWATEKLREEDLNYRPSEDSRKAGETLDHLYNLSITIANSMEQKANIRPREKEDLDFAGKRKKTLENFQRASNILKSSNPGDVEKYEIVFQREETKSVYPFWNLLNGPIADAIYHTGQIVALRRASGNPLDPRVSVFMGKTRE